MTKDIRVAAALMGYNFADQQTILRHIKEGNPPEGNRLKKGYDEAKPILDEGYGGFPVERATVDRNKSQDRNVGRVIQTGGTQVLVTGRKADGRYTVVNKDGTKTAKDPQDLNLVVKEKFDLDSYFDWDSEELDQLSFKELEEIAEEVLAEIEEEGLLAEALEAIDDICLLNEATSRHSAFPNVAVQKPKNVDLGKDKGAEARKRLQSKSKPESKPQVSRKEKVKAAVKSAAATAGRAVGSAAGKAVNTGEKVGKAVKSGASKAGGAVKKVARGAGEVAGSAAGGFAAGYAAARKKTGDSKSSGSGSTTSGKPTGASVVSNKGVATKKDNKPGLRDKIKSGLKKAVGGAARSISRGARGVARKLGETHNWREHVQA